MIKKFVPVFLIIFFISTPILSGENNRKPEKYELKLIYIFEAKEPEFIYAIGNSGFRSVEKLKNFLGELPPGSEIMWDPGCLRFGSEPLLSSEKDMKAFRIFLEGRGIKLNIIPSVAGKPSIDVPRGTLNSVLKQAGLKE